MPLVVDKEQYGTVSLCFSALKKPCFAKRQNRFFSLCGRNRFNPVTRLQKKQALLHCFLASVSMWDMRFSSHALHSSMLKGSGCECEGMYRLVFSPQVTAQHTQQSASTYESAVPKQSPSLWLSKPNQYPSLLQLCCRR